MKEHKEIRLVQIFIIFRSIYLEYIFLLVALMKIF